MSTLSDRILSVTPSATMAMTQAARDAKAAGRDVISLSSGEPDFNTPAHIIDAAKAAMDRGETRYTAVDGIPELKQAIIDKFARDNGLSFAADQITVGPGGKTVIWNALACTVNPGDAVIIPAPCWVSYPDMVRLCGGVPVVLPCSGAQNFKLTPDQLAASITPKTRWLLLNSPGNPSGAVYSADEMRALAEVLRAHPQVWILSDDIYEALVYGQARFVTLAAIAPDLADRTLTMNGVSKAYAMTGWRIGYAGGPAELIGAMRKFMGQTTSNPASISQWAAVAALNGPQDFLDDWRATYMTRRDLMVSALDAVPGLSVATPDGAFYAFINCEAAVTRLGLTDDAALAMHLLESANVATVPGSAFHAPGHLRLSYAAATDEIARACERIATALT